MRPGLALPIAALSCVLALAHPHAEPQASLDLASLLDQYGRGEFDTAATAGARDPDALVKALGDRGVKWIDADPAARSHRALVAASFALEAADRILEGSRRLLYRESLEWGCSQVRTAPPGEGVVAWYLASVALVQRADDPWMLVGPPATESASDQPKAAGHLAHAAALASTEPRFLLAGPVAGERRSWDINGILTESRSQEALLAAADRYSKLVDVPAIGAEARLRRGAVRLRVGLPVAAIEDFTIVTARAADPYLLYLGHLFAGVAYERLRHSSDALQHYRAALDVAPRAQSASVRLVALLMTMDRRDEASTVTEDFFANTPPRDPWRSYSSGDARFWPEYLARLRKALQ